MTNVGGQGYPDANLWRAQGMNNPSMLPPAGPVVYPSMHPMQIPPPRFGGPGADTYMSSFAPKKDAAHDGKFSLGTALKNFGKGLISPVTAMFESPSAFFKGALMIAGGAALMAVTGGAAAPLLLAVGVGFGVKQTADGLKKISEAENGDDIENAFTDFGAATSSIGLSVAGAKTSLKASGKFSAAEVNNMSVTQATIANLKAAPGSATASVQSFSGMGSKFAAMGAKMKATAASGTVFKNPFKKATYKGSPASASYADAATIPTAKISTYNTENLWPTPAPKSTPTTSTSSAPTQNWWTTSEAAPKTAGEIAAAAATKETAPLNSWSPAAAEAPTVPIKQAALTATQEARVAEVASILKTQLKGASAADIDNILLAVSEADRPMAAVLLKRMTQHGNLDSMNGLMSRVDDFAAQSGSTIHNEGGTGFASNMDYLFNKKGGGYYVEPATGQHAGLKSLFQTGQVKPGSVVMLDETMLAKLESNPALLAEMKPQAGFVEGVSGVRFVYPEGWINGSNPFSYASAGELQARMLPVLDRAKTLMAEGKATTMEQATAAALHEPIQARLQGLGIEGQTTVIRQPGASFSTATADDIAAQLAPKTMTDAELAGVLKANNLQGEHADAFLNVLAKQAEVYSPARLVKIAREQQVGILQHAASKGIHADDIYYLVPQEGKSYGMVTRFHQEANGIKPQQIITDVSQIPQGKKSMTVILDDVVGTGDSMYTQAHNILETQGYTGELYASAYTAATNARVKYMDPYGDIRPQFTYAPHSESVPLTQSEWFQGLTKAEQKAITKVAGQVGTNNLGYGGEVNVAFPYMAPDNNTGIGEIIASFFTLNGKGVK